MNSSQVLALIFVRVCAIYTAAGGISSGLRTFQEALGKDLGSVELLHLTGVNVGLPVLAGLVIWVVARPIALLMVADANSSDQNPPLITNEVAQRGAAILVGLYMLFSGVVGAARVLAIYVQTSGTLRDGSSFFSSTMGTTLFLDCFQVVLSLWIMLDSDRFFRCLDKVKLGSKQNS